ncbi:hypothetical protein CDO73_21385 [Saccharibacillus sp. O23]|uniref:DUF5050 domain-containing protein n=1 Tax=Saccharibacillus sp. O23 TaxID=2009338 RepID=UPI000B4E3085|nr:DUF5050 domain-containing protein [Saccharibacillus sp. O23]OWR27744.1 hypothetical protein CDO73_21385 [Saccharibacillus sp. O23]
MEKRIAKRLAIAGAAVLLIAISAWALWRFFVPPEPSVDLYRMEPGSTPARSDLIRSDDRHVFLIDRASGYRIYGLDRQSDRLTKLTSGPAIWLLPDGEDLYYAESGPNSGVYRMDKDGGSKEKLADLSFTSLIGLADGMLYLLDGDANYAIKKLDTRSGELSTLTEDWSGPAELHDGKLYSVNHTNDWSLEVMNLDGSDVHTLVDRDVMEFFFVSEGILTRNERGQIDLHRDHAKPGDPPIQIVSYSAHAETIGDRLFYSQDDGTINQTLVLSGRSLVMTPEMLLRKPDPPAFGDFFIAGDWLYYYDGMNNKSRLHRFKLPEGFATPLPSGDSR